jgi:hypothetical protein
VPPSGITINGNVIEDGWEVPQGAATVVITVSGTSGNIAVYPQCQLFTGNGNYTFYITISGSQSINLSDGDCV